MSHFLVLTMTAALAAKQPKPGDWSFGWLTVAAIAEVALAVIIGSWLISTYLSVYRYRIHNSPWRLFTNLCTVHKLTRRERYLLQRLAHEHQLDQPATLFVEPSWYNREKLGPSWVRCVEELDTLRNRLFAAG